MCRLADLGVLSSVALLDERLGPLTVVGGGIVLIGLWLVEHRATEPRSASRHIEANAADA